MYIRSLLTFFVILALPNICSAGVIISAPSELKITNLKSPLDLSDDASFPFFDHRLRNGMSPLGMTQNLQTTSQVQAATTIFPIDDLMLIEPSQSLEFHSKLQFVPEPPTWKIPKVPRVS